MKFRPSFAIVSCCPCAALQTRVLRTSVQKAEMILYGAQIGNYYFHSIPFHFFFFWGGGSVGSHRMIQDSGRILAMMA